MSIDLFLWAQTGEQIKSFFRANRLLEGDDPVRGAELTPWAGSARFMVAPGTYDDQLNEITPPTFDGVAYHVRLHFTVAEDDAIDDTPADPENVKVWERSAIAKNIRGAGPARQWNGLDYYQSAGIRLFELSAVQQWCLANGVPSHEYI